MRGALIMAKSMKRGDAMGRAKFMADTDKAQKAEWRLVAPNDRDAPSPEGTSPRDLPRSGAQ